MAMETFFDKETLKHVIELVSSAIALLASFVQPVISRKTSRGAAEIIDSSKPSREQKEEVKGYVDRWKRSAQRSWIVLGVMSALILGVAVWRYLQPPAPKVLSNYLNEHDPVLFPYQGDYSFDIAKIFPDRQSLSTEANLGVTLHQTESSFDLLAEHGSSVIIDYRKNITDALKKGVKFRVIILNVDDVEAGKHDELIKTTTAGGATLEQKRLAFLSRLIQVRSVLTEINQEIKNNKKLYKGNLEVRVLSRPVLYRMWIKDRELPDKAIAHLTVHQYRGNSESPSFRFTNRESARLMASLQKDFDAAWALSTVLEGTAAK
jgi:hypothetical protein